MIKHVVMWKLKENAGGLDKRKNAQKIKELLESLPKKISQIKYLQVGISEDIDDANASSYDACLITLFESMEDLEIYQEHPEHKKVSAFVASVREARSVVDFAE